MPQPVLALVNLPFWDVGRPCYAISLLRAEVAARGYRVVVPELEIRLFHQVDVSEKVHWNPTESGFWIAGDGPNALFDRYRDSFFVPAARELIDAGVTVLGLSVNLCSITMSQRFARMIKEMAPWVHIVAGGRAAWTQAEVIASTGDIDAVCLGEGDLVFPDYVDHLARQGAPSRFEGFAIRQPDGSLSRADPPPLVRDLDALPFPDYRGLRLDLYQQAFWITSMFTRGCVQRCVFCAETTTLRVRSGRNVCDELEWHTRVLGPEYIRFFFNDSAINSDLRAFESLADEVLARGLRIEFGGQAIPRRDMSAALLDKVGRAGCRQFMLGVESGSDAVLRRMGRGLQTRETAIRFVRQARACGITCTLSFIVGFPGETESQFYETISFVREVVDDILAVRFNRAGVPPGSRLSCDCEAFGLPAGTLGTEYSSSDGTNTPELRTQRQQILQALFYPKVDFLAPPGTEYAFWEGIRKRIEDLEVRCARVPDCPVESRPLNGKPELEKRIERRYEKPQPNRDLLGKRPGPVEAPVAEPASCDDPAKVGRFAAMLLGLRPQALAAVGLAPARAWEEGGRRLSISFDAEPGRPGFTLTLEPRDDERGACERTAHLNLSYQASLRVDVSLALVRRAASRLASVTYEDCRAALAGVAAAT